MIKKKKKKKRNERNENKKNIKSNEQDLKVREKRQIWDQHVDMKENVKLKEE